MENKLQEEQRILTPEETNLLACIQSALKSCGGHIVIQEHSIGFCVKDGKILNTGDSAVDADSIGRLIQTNTKKS